MNTNKKIEMLVTWLLLAIFLTSCAVAPDHAVIADGMVEAIHYGTVVHGLKAVMAETPFTYIMAKKDLTMLIWSLRQNGWAFVVLSTKNGIVNPIDTWEAVTGGKGNLCNATTFRMLQDTLEQNGWKVITTATVAETIRDGIAAMAVWGTRVMPTFLVFPAGIPLEDVLPPAGEDT